MLLVLLVIKHTQTFLNIFVKDKVIPSQSVCYLNYSRQLRDTLYIHICVYAVSRDLRLFLCSVQRAHKRDPRSQCPAAGVASMKPIREEVPQRV